MMTLTHLVKLIIGTLSFIYSLALWDNLSLRENAVCYNIFCENNLRADYTYTVDFKAKTLGCQVLDDCGCTEQYFVG